MSFNSSDDFPFDFLLEAVVEPLLGRLPMAFNPTALSCEPWMRLMVQNLGVSTELWVIDQESKIHSKTKIPLKVCT